MVGSTHKERILTLLDKLDQEADVTPEEIRMLKTIDEEFDPIQFLAILTSHANREEYRAQLTGNPSTLENYKTAELIVWRIEGEYNENLPLSVIAHVLFAHPSVVRSLQEVGL